MDIQIKVQHLASIKEITINLADTIVNLKKKIEEVYSIPSSQQSLSLDDRNISTSTKYLNELGIKSGSTIVVKKIHKFTGKKEGGDITSLMKNPFMKNMLKNPETMKTIQEMFPDLKEELAENKTLNMIINNGGLEEELEKMTNDSDYMSNQLRNADVAMSKLENIPGGINMMSSIIKEVEDPFKMVMGPPELKEGSKVLSMPTKSIPGKAKKNLLIEYRKQLYELKEIGFCNTKENIEVLESVDGNLQAALEILVERHNN